MNAEVISEDGIVQVAGEDYRELQITVKLNDITSHQKYLLRLKDGNMTMIISSYTDETEAVAEEMINSFEAL